MGEVWRNCMKLRALCGGIVMRMRMCMLHQHGAHMGV